MTRAALAPLEAPITILVISGTLASRATDRGAADAFTAVDSVAECTGGW